MIEAKRRRYGYKGTQTALNGLSQWVQLNKEFKGKAYDNTIDAYKIVVEYAVYKFPDFNNKGIIENKATNAAAIINNNGLFTDFMNWFKTKKL